MNLKYLFRLYFYIGLFMQNVVETQILRKKTEPVTLFQVTMVSELVVRQLKEKFIEIFENSLLVIIIEGKKLTESTNFLGFGSKLFLFLLVIQVETEVLILIH